jgi:hypothetical protein
MCIYSTSIYIARLSSAQPLTLLGCASLCFCLQRNYRTFLMFIYSTSIYIARLSSAQPLTLLGCALPCFCLQRN